MSAAKWIGKWLLQVPVYLVTSFVVRQLIGSCYQLLVKAGANMPPNFLLQHFLWVGFIAGFIGGVVGMVGFCAMLLLPVQFEPASARVWERPQAWTWVFGTLWLAFGVMSWLGNHAPHSVLMTSGAAVPGIFDVFFGSGCLIPARYSDYGFVLDCMKQITFTHPWMGTLGYSGAAFVPVGWLGPFRRSSFLAKQIPERELPEEGEAESHV